MPIEPTPLEHAVREALRERDEARDAVRLLRTLLKKLDLSDAPDGWKEAHASVLLATKGHES